MKQRKSKRYVKLEDGRIIDTKLSTSLTKKEYVIVDNALYIRSYDIYNNPDNIMYYQGDVIEESDTL